MKILIINIHTKSKPLINIIIKCHKPDHKMSQSSWYFLVSVSRDFVSVSRESCFKLHAACCLRFNQHVSRDPRTETVMSAPSKWTKVLVMVSRVCIPPLYILFSTCAKYCSKSKMEKANIWNDHSLFDVYDDDILENGSPFPRFRFWQFFAGMWRG